jgi:hypothetical protein
VLLGPLCHDPYAEDAQQLDHVNEHVSVPSFTVHGADLQPTTAVYILTLHAAVHCQEGTISHSHSSVRTVSIHTLCQSDTIVVLCNMT